jgi:hypothetical protein
MLQPAIATVATAAVWHVHIVVAAVPHTGLLLLLTLYTKQ